MRKSDNQISNGFAFFLIILLIGFFVWGFFGEKLIQKTGLDCDWGIKDKLCWSWHTNKMDRFQENIRNTTSAKLDEIVNPNE